MRDDAFEPLQPLKQSIPEKKSLLLRLWNIFTGFFTFLWRMIIGFPRLVRTIGRGSSAVSVWCVRETAYSFHLFTYTSRRFLRTEVYLALAGAFLFFGILLTQGQVDNQRDLLYYCYIFFTAIMILLAMNLLPKEREEETLEILWSQPMNRNRLIVIQLTTLTLWISLLTLAVMLVFGRYSAYQEGRWLLLYCVLTTSFAVGAITVLISTFCRHAIATGLVAMLILGVHLFWLRSLGPIELYYNPIVYAGQKAPQGAAFNLHFNRIMLIFLVGFILDYLFRRLKRTAEWFT
ncbi:MAG: ABC transporter permease subunit [Candidatus Omnitrophota bacterium]